MDAGRAKRVVLIHDWLTGMPAGRSAWNRCRRWPDARLVTLLHKRGSVSPTSSESAFSPARSIACRGSSDIIATSSPSCRSSPGGESPRRTW